MEGMVLRSPWRLVMVSRAPWLLVAAAASACECGATTNTAAPIDGGTSDASSGAVPITLASCMAMADAGVPAGTLAVRQSASLAIAVDESSVYWLDLGSGGGGGKSPAPYAGGQVMKCAKAGCNLTPTVLGAAIASSPEFPMPFAVGPSGVYFEDFEIGIEGCPLDGCAVGEALVTAASGTSLAADATNLYLSGGGDNALVAVPLEGDAGSTTLFDSGGSDWAEALAVDAADVYFVTLDGTVMKCAVGGCNGAPTTLVSGPIAGASTSIALDADNVYWTVINGSPGQILACPKTGCAAPTVLVAGRVGLGPIATDGVAVYFTELGNNLVDDQSVFGAGGVYKCAVGGCAGGPATVAGYQTNPEGIAVDPGPGGKVYWTTGACDGALVMSGDK